ncbi:MAG: recombinase family protein [Candidatus Dependentiae bacterium]
MKLSYTLYRDGQVINSKISAVEKFQFSISLGLAKYYSDAISDNVKRAIEQKLRKGEWLALAPFGYKNSTKADGSTDVIVDDYNAHILKKAFELYATGAYSMEILCKKIKEDFGIDWPKGQLGKILSNPFYHGTMVVKHKEYPHRYPPLISKALFDQVKQVRDSFQKKPFKYAGIPYIYRGLIRCGECDCAITPEKHKGFVYYHCTQYKGKHGAKWFREEYITEQLSTVFKSLQMPKDVCAQIAQSLDELHQEKIEFYNKEFDKLTREQKSTTTMLDNLYLDKLRGRITESEYDRFYQSLRQELMSINVRLERLQEADDNYYTTAKQVLDLTNRTYELFLSSEVEEKRQLIKLLLSNLRIEGEKLLWDVVKPFDLIVNCSDRQQWRG